MVMVLRLPMYPVMSRKRMKELGIFYSKQCRRIYPGSFREMDLYEFHRGNGCISDIEGRIISKFHMLTTQ